MIRPRRQAVERDRVAHGRGVAVIMATIALSIPALPGTSAWGVADGHPASATSSHPRASEACTPEQFNASLTSHVDCGAHISVPGTLALVDCAKVIPNAPYAAGSLCTKEITLQVAVAGGNPAATAVPPAINYSFQDAKGNFLYSNVDLYPHQWCSETNPNCSAADPSAPQWVMVSRNYPLGRYPKDTYLVIKVLGYGQYSYAAYATVHLTKGPVPKSDDSLAASIKLTDAKGGQLAAKSAIVGTKLVATVRLSVKSSAPGPVTGIRVSPPVALSPTTILQQQRGPSPPLESGGLTISPGSSFTYQVTYVVTAAGTVILSVKAKGTTPNGRSTRATDSVKARLGQPLEVLVNWLKDGKPLSTTVNGKVRADALRLADGPDGELPTDITARVIVKNTSKTTQENVSLNGVPPFSFATKAQAVRALPVTITSPMPKLTFAPIAPGAQATADFNVRVTNNGTFNFTPQALSSSAGSTETNVSEATSTLTVLPTKLLWLSLHPLEKGLVNPGTPVLIGGTVTNRSLTQTLQLDPLLATITGSAGGGELVDQKGTTQLDGVALPFAGEVAPGATIDVIGEVGTSLVPGSRAEVSYAPTGTVTNADATSQKLTPGDVGATEGSTPIAVHLNVSDPPVPPSDIGSIANNFVNSTFFYTAKYSYLAFKGVGDVLASPGATLSHGAGLVKSVIVAGGHSLADVAHLQASVYLLASVGSALTPEQRQKWADEVVADYKASHLKIAADKAQALYAAVNTAAYNAFVPFVHALDTGDYNTVAALSGQGFGAGLTTVGDLLVSDIIFQKFLIGLGQVPSALRALPSAAGKVSTSLLDAATSVRSAIKSQFAQDITLAAELRNAKIAQSLGKGLPGIVAGQNLLANASAALRDIYGLTKSQIAALQQFCATNKLVIAVRSRSRRAAELIRDGLAVGKNEILKIKNVNEIDWQYLGYSKADLNLMVWAEPVPIDYVMAKLSASGASALERDVVLQRYYLRKNEWVNPKITKVIDQAKKSGQIQWNLDGSGNGASTLIEQTRSFGLRPQPSPVSVKLYPSTAKRTYQQVLVGNKPMVNGKIVKGTRLVPVTQDVDLMAILTASGEILGAEQRAKVYEYLANLIGIEHGETPAWILNGELIFQAKAKILADAIPGGEALAVFAPDLSVTAGFYNPALTTFNNATKTGRIFFDGGYNSAYYLWQQKLRTSLGNFAGIL